MEVRLPTMYAKRTAGRVTTVAFSCPPRVPRLHLHPKVLSVAGK